jgi:DNA modification methylase
MDQLTNLGAMPLIMDQASGDNFHIWNDDCIAVMKGIPNDSIHMAIWSPPFCSLYVFSDDPRDVSNNRNDAVFFDHYRFVLAEVFRIIKPGRLISIHCMNLPTSITRDGFIGMRDFRGDNIRLCQDVGFIYHSEVAIRKDPVSAMQRTKAIGLLHKQVVKDSALSRMAIADYIVTMRKPGENDKPISGIFETYHGDDMTDAELTAYANANYQPGGNRSREENKSIHIWQRYAEPIWTDINQSDVLSHRVARAEHDERHISPLQLTPIRRCLDLWTNPGDVVFSPFAGIGSVGYIALEMGRRFCGAELKASYFRQAAFNLRLAERMKNDGTLFDAAMMADQFDEADEPDELEIAEGGLFGGE